MKTTWKYSILLVTWMVLGLPFTPEKVFAEAYLDNQTQYSNQDPAVETRRSDHFRLCFGQYDRDGGMSEQLAQGNLQMFERMWNRWVNETGMGDINESGDPAKRDGNKYRANFNFLMTFNDGGGGGAYMSADGNGFAYAMANPGYCRYDAPSGATPHEMGHVWEGRSNGFNGTNSSGMWWECTANWMQLQFLNSYPGPYGYIVNSMYYPAHGRDFYDSWLIWEAARDDARYGGPWVTRIWTDADANQRVNEFIIDRMFRVDTSGSLDKPGAVKDLWGDMARKAVTMDYSRKQWFTSGMPADDGSNWDFYRTGRTPLVKVPGMTGWYRPARAHMPMEYGWNTIPLSAAAGQTVSCTFQPQCDPVRQSDWRACLVAVSTNGDARYSDFWNTGTNSIRLSSDETRLYLVVIAVPKPMPTASPSYPLWAAYATDAGAQFPYRVSFTNASPRNATYPVPDGLQTWTNGGGRKAGSATVAPSVWIGPNAMVLGSANVQGNARIEDYAVVTDNAQVRDNAVISGHALVHGNAQVYGNATVRDWANVGGFAEVYEDAKVLEHASIADGGDAITHNKAYGNAVLKGTTVVYRLSNLAGSIIMEGDTANGNANADNSLVADHGVHFGWGWGQDAARFPALVDNSYLYVQHDFETQNGLYAAGTYGSNRYNAVLAMDKYGINHGFLMNGVRAALDTLAPTRGGYVLPLNGINQYVELHNSANDFKDMSVSVWIKWAGTASDQRLFSLGDGASKVMYFTPKDSTTQLSRFFISDGTTTQSIEGTSAIPTNSWTHIAVTLSGNTGTLYVNGVVAGTNDGMTLDPDQLNAPLMENANYLGRGNTGNYFQGAVDDFRIYMKALDWADVTTIYETPDPVPVTIPNDNIAPVPNAATWLVEPTALSDSAITMSATPGTDTSGWVEYYFTCTSGGGHDSGWVSFNKYNDVGLTPGTTCTYTVKMRDQKGNTTIASAPLSASTKTSVSPTAAFDENPAGFANGQVRMKAVIQRSVSGLVEYKFDRLSPSAASSGWQASPSWTDTGLSTGVTCNYTVTVRDGHGNTSAASPAVATTANDKSAPQLPPVIGQWNMLPYATIDNKVSMTANTPADGTDGVQYRFLCTAGGGPSSDWINIARRGTADNQWLGYYQTSTLPDGSYTYCYQLKDAAGNLSALSTPYVATITPYSGYHPYNMAQLATLPDDYLVTFNGLLTEVNAFSYVVKDPVTGYSISVETSTSRDKKTKTTDDALLLKNVTINGHLYTRSGARVVTYSTVTAAGGGGTTFSISGKVTNLAGAAIAGATVYISATPNASLNAGITVTTDASGNYTWAISEGLWYMAAGDTASNTSADQLVSVVGANVANVNFTLVPNVTVAGRVTHQADGSVVSNATVSFSRTPGGTAICTATTNASGDYSQSLQNGTWYVFASKTGYFSSSEQGVEINGAAVTGINFTIQSDTRDIPRVSDLLFSVDTSRFTGSNGASTGNWPLQYLDGQDVSSDPSKVASTIATPTVETLNGQKWERNIWSDGDGYLVQDRTDTPFIPFNGGTIVAVVKPYKTPKENGYGGMYIVSIGFNGGQNFSLAMYSNTREIRAMRNGAQYNTGVIIPEGQSTVLAYVVESDGAFKIFANGALVYTQTAQSTFTGLDLSGNAWYQKNIHIGKGFTNDTGSSFNGNIGDVLVYTVALSVAERQQIETDLSNKFGLNSTSCIVTATAGAGGAISPSGSVAVNSGTSKAFTITPNAGYVIADVKVDGVSQGAVGSYTFTNVKTAHSIAATFRATDFTIVAAAGANGTITPSGSVGVVSGGAQVFTIAPQPGYSIADVKVNNISVGAVGSYTFTNVLANKTIKASFSQMTRTVTATAGLNGTITPSGAVPMTYSAQQTFTITPDAGYEILDVEIDGTSVGAVPSCQFSQVTTNHTVTATFKAIKTHTVTAIAGPNGSIKPAETSTVNDGVNLAVTITPDTGYAIQDVVVDGVSMGTVGEYLFTKVKADHMISATFRALLPPTVPVHTIITSAGTGGSISPSGAVTVNEGEDLAFTIAANTGYVIEDVQVDGVSMGPITTHTFNNVNADHTITATFLLTDHTPPTPNPATFETPPKAVGSGAITMTAAMGTDESGTVEYNFAEISGNPGGASSGWQVSPNYTNTGLTPSTQYSYTVQIRDAFGNTGTVSLPQSATTDRSVAGSPIGDWTFATDHAGTAVTNGQAIAAGVLKNTSSIAPVEDPANKGHAIFGSPAFATYNTVTEGLPAGDGFAMNTTNGYPYWSDNNSAAQLAFATNNTFSGWALAKRTADSGAAFETVLGRPFNWKIGVNSSNKIEAIVGGVTCTTNRTWTVGAWHALGFSYSGTGAGDGTFTIYVDGVADKSFTPGAFGTGDVFHIGNGPGGSERFAGLFDRVLFWDSVETAQTFADLSAVGDTQPPTPNPATFATPPVAISRTAITMTATVGIDASGPVEYLFTETSGHGGGSSSSWQTSPTYTDTGLMPGIQYTYTVQMRDAQHNTGTVSVPASATTRTDYAVFIIS